MKQARPDLFSFKLKWFLTTSVLVLSSIGLWNISSYSKAKQAMLNQALNKNSKIGSFNKSQAEIKAMQGKAINRAIASVDPQNKEFPQKFLGNPMFKMFISLQNNKK